MKDEVRSLEHWTSSLLEPLPMQNAGERVADRLVTAIALGEFVPGQRLPPERELAVMLKMSRGVVREAVQRLAASGYVTVMRGRNGGAFVNDYVGPEAQSMIRRVLIPQRERLEHLLDMRSLIESEIARTAAVRRDKDDVAEIKEALRGYEQADSDRSSSAAADREVHLAIARATHNPLLEALSLQIRNEVSLGFGAEPFSPSLRQRALHQHPALARAVIDGNTVDAARVAKEHFSLTEELLHKLMATVESTEERAIRIKNADIRRTLKTR